MDKERKNALEKTGGFLKNEKNKKILKIVLLVIGALLLVGLGFYLAYRYYISQEDDYDLYDELDDYYDDFEEEDEDKAKEKGKKACAESEPEAAKEV